MAHLLRASSTLFVEICRFSLFPFNGAECGVIYKADVTHPQRQGAY